MKEILKAYFFNNFQASTIEIEQLVSVFTEKVAQKNEILISKGEPC
jgi:hypothetical protein